MTTYLDVEVLTQRSNTREDQQDSFHQSVYVLDPNIGKRFVHARAACPTVVRTYLWTCATRTAIAELKAWLAVRRGQLRPFWLPTWRKDLVLSSPIAAQDSGIITLASGYTQYCFPQHSRRHIAVCHPDGTMVCRQITSAQNYGQTEALGLSSPLGISAPLESLVCYLTYCRLGSDDVTINYLTDSIAEAELQITEIPQEAP